MEKTIKELYKEAVKHGLENEPYDEVVSFLKIPADEQHAQCANTVRQNIAHILT